MRFTVSIIAACLGFGCGCGLVLMIVDRLATGQREFGDLVFWPGEVWLDKTEDRPFLAGATLPLAALGTFAYMLVGLMLLLALPVLLGAFSAWAVMYA